MIRGTVTDVPKLPGTWSVWSPAGHSPGAYFLVPADDQARAHGKSSITVRLSMVGAGTATAVKVLES